MFRTGRIKMCEDNVNYEGYIHGDHPFWNQSYVFHVYDARNKIGGHIRIGIHENLQESNNWLLFLIDGKPLYVRTNINLPYTSSRLDEGIEVAGMRAISLEPLKKVRLEYSSADFTLDLLCEGLAPMVDCIAMSLDSSGSAFPKEYNYAHMEGPCRYSGSIKLGSGKRFEIDGVGFRDVALGPREWSSMLYYGMTWPVFSNGVAFSGIHGISTSGRNAYMKMLYDGQQWLRIKRFEDWNEFAEDGLTIKSLHWKYWDENDRIWEYSGKSLYSWTYPCDNFVQMQQGFEYRLSDGTVGYGMAEQGFRLDSIWSEPETNTRLANTLVLGNKK